jgi:hypothetical protein
MGDKMNLGSHVQSVPTIYACNFLKICIFKPIKPMIACIKQEIPMAFQSRRSLMAIACWMIAIGAFAQNSVESFRSASTGQFSALHLQGKIAR